MKIKLILLEILELIIAFLLVLDTRTFESSNPILTRFYKIMIFNLDIKILLILALIAVAITINYVVTLINQEMYERKLQEVKDNFTEYLTELDMANEDLKKRLRKKSIKANK